MSSLTQKDTSRIYWLVVSILWLQVVMSIVLNVFDLRFFSFSYWKLACVFCCAGWQSVSSILWLFCHDCSPHNTEPSMYSVTSSYQTFHVWGLVLRATSHGNILNAPFNIDDINCLQLNCMCLSICWSSYLQFTLLNSCPCHVNYRQACAWECQPFWISDILL